MGMPAALCATLTTVMRYCITKFVLRAQLINDDLLNTAQYSIAERVAPIRTNIIYNRVMRVNTRLNNENNKQ